jgi:hypothetical protein
MDEKLLKEKAAEKRREYKRKWYAENKDKARRHTQDYWKRKVLSEEEAKAPKADPK